LPFPIFSKSTLFLSCFSCMGLGARISFSLFGDVFYLVSPPYIAPCALSRELSSPSAFSVAIVLFPFLSVSFKGGAASFFPQSLFYREAPFFPFFFWRALVFFFFFWPRRISPGLPLNTFSGLSMTLGKCRLFITGIFFSLIPLHVQLLPSLTPLRRNYFSAASSHFFFPFRGTSSNCSSRPAPTRRLRFFPFFVPSPLWWAAPPKKPSGNSCVDSSFCAI